MVEVGCMVVCVVHVCERMWGTSIVVTVEDAMLAWPDAFVSLTSLRGLGCQPLATNWLAGMAAYAVGERLTEHIYRM